MDGTLAVVHNGIVENFAALRAELLRKGYVIKSDTDTELIVHLIADVRKQKWMPLDEAVRQAMTQVHGAYGIAVISSDEPGMLIGARKGSPLILGVGSDEYILASDAAAVIERTKNVCNAPTSQSPHRAARRRCLFRASDLLAGQPASRPGPAGPHRALKRPPFPARLSCVCR